MSTETMNNEKRLLDYYVNNFPEVGVVGISAIQRTCRVSYNQAAKIEKLGIKTGVLKRDDDIAWLHTKGV